MSNILKKIIGSVPLLTLSLILVSLFSTPFTQALEGNDSNTKLLLHMDGADDGTVFTDSASGATETHTVTRINTVTKTGTKKFGTTSAYFDGDGDWLTIPASDDWAIGTDDFTLDFWIKRSSHTGNVEFPIAQIDDNGWEFGQFQVMIFPDGSLKISLNSGGGMTHTVASTTLITDTDWHHIALVRDKSYLRMFIDGVNEQSIGLSNGLSFYVSDADLSIGRVRMAGMDLGFFDGYIDEFRMSKNTARWISDFTPPTVAYSEDSWTAENYAIGGSTGWAEFTFTPPQDIPTGGRIMFMIPDEFSMIADADLTDDITTFTADGVDVTGNINTATLTTATGNIININLGTAIDRDEEIILRFDSSIFGTNPSEAGQYAIAISTHNSEGTTVDYGYAMANISNTADVTLAVQEAIIVTLDGTSINLNVDPSVNDGKDFSQKSVLEGKTNAQGGYRIQAKLADGNDGSTAQLYNSDTGDFINTGNALNDENRLGYIGYNASETKTQAQLESDASSAASFGNSAGDLLTYEGAGSYVETLDVTNSQYHTIYYTLNVDYLTPAGDYTGTITYTAVPSF
jgi:hypothetical protein